MAYGKAFESTFSGSMVGAGPVVFAVWFYVIANSKPPGLVELHPRLLAAILGAEVAEVEGAIQTLCRPDPESRTPDEEGRKLVQEGNFLYRMPTWPKYNAIRKEEDRRRQNREAQARWRDRQRLVSKSKRDKPTEMETLDADAAMNECSNGSVAVSERRTGDAPSTYKGADQ